MFLEAPDGVVHHMHNGLFTRCEIRASAVYWRLDELTHVAHRTPTCLWCVAGTYDFEGA